MEMVYVKIMLYLGVICSPCDYTESEIQNIYDDNEPEIYDVKDDEELVNQIKIEYEEEAEFVIIGDDYEEN